MIDVYFWMTPNGYKVTIALEELGMPYNVIPINIGKGDQFKPEFLKVSPNNKIPAMVDPDGPGGKPISIFESGAILIYLAEKSGKLMPKEPRGRYNVLEWLMFQMASVGPMLGQAHHFRALRARADPVRDRSLHQRGQAHLQRDRQAPGRSAVPRRRLLDRRHRDLSVAAAA